MLLLRTPSFASVSANLLPSMHVGVQTLCVVVLCWDHTMKCTIDAIMCWIGLFMRNILFMLLVIYVCCVECYGCWLLLAIIA